VANTIITRIFGGGGDDDDQREVDPDTYETTESDLDEATSEPATGPVRPRSLADAWDRLAVHNKRLERRLEDLEKVQSDLLTVTKDLAEHSRKQVEVLHLLGKFHESAEKRGRQMEHAFQGVPDVLRTLPSATREQAEKLSEIAARLYEKAQDNTVNALKSAQANHQRVIEELLDKSLHQSRRLTLWAMCLTVVSVAAALFIYLSARLG
jgi:DNA repair exonuclease SbcCD ATPase subunit